MLRIVVSAQRNRIATVSSRTSRFGSILLTLPTAESALLHFRHSFLTVTLQDGEVIIWDEGKSLVQHSQVHKGERIFV